MQVHGSQSSVVWILFSRLLEVLRRWRHRVLSKHAIFQALFKALTKKASRDCQSNSNNQRSDHNQREQSQWRRLLNQRGGI